MTFEDAAEIVGMTRKSAADLCPECGEDIGSPNVEAFEHLGLVMCDFCAEANLEATSDRLALAEGE